MNDSSEMLDGDTLAELLAQRCRNLRYLEQQAAAHGGATPLDLHNALEHERQQMERLLAELRQRGIQAPAAAAGEISALYGEPAALPRAPGSPFVVGRPLRANEPIFGRDSDRTLDALPALSGTIALRPAGRAHERHAPHAAGRAGRTG